MNIMQNVDLAGFNTLAVPARAAYFVEVTTLDELQEALAFSRQRNKAPVVLGGGSNVVLTGDIDGLVVRLALRGVECSERGDERLVTAAAGENWHELVCYCIAQGYYGLENLIAIPGSVGAAPIQNIGAYGVELSKVLESVTGWDCEQSQLRTLSAEQCQLSYRDSIFKHELKDLFIITSVCLRLSAIAHPEVSYPALRAELSDPEQVSPQQIAEHVAAIRAAKLPDYRREPNAGSFFKNPLISAEKATELLGQYPGLAHWPMSNGQVKLAAAWLVDQSGWKGRREGGVGIHPKQAIVVVNYDACSGRDILGFAARIQADVLRKYGVTLDIEPRVY
ncbi:UDP-N-acetylmuramate dehydrogenase [Zhongshania sp. CAU 1632]|uniref:UDP-N-acetylenolpyruvoylglucosamine reductase n=2 Tax=Zhongshania aquimaris TaxID=2857107 RepID=A0ABS6VUE4_9GAMM|nr:UDP-N-acetylmuramate dehydrogenase [Zhongshania aquimaris]